MNVAVELITRKNRSVWRLTYGAVFAALLVGIAVAIAINPPSLLQGLIKGLRPKFLHSLPILLGLIVFFSLLERLLPAAGPRKPIKGYILNFKVTLLHAVAGLVTASMVGAGIAALGSHLGLGLIDLRFSTGHGMADLLLAFLLSTFIFDFFFYWYHRFQHESFLWQEHKLHHMDEELCALYRESWLEGLISGPLASIPLAILFKLNPAQGAINSALFLAWVVFIHSNVRMHWGRFGVLFNGPQGHRIHHSRLHEHHDKNFAAFFPIWDVLFGTYHYPKRDEYPLTGVHDEKEVKGFWEAAVLPFRAWRKILREWRSRRAAI